MSLPGLDISVIGGGIGGLAAALALSGRGAQVTVFEQAGALREVGAGLQVSPNGLRVIEALGLGEALAARAVRGRAVSLRDFRRGQEVARLDLGLMPEDQRYFFVHRADLIDILADAARERGVDFRLGCRVSDVRPGARPELVFEDGARAQAGLIVGADGLRSTMRTALIGSAEPWFTGQVAWRAVIPNLTGQGTEAQVHMGPGRHLVCYPLTGDRLNLVAVEEREAWAGEGWHHRDDPDTLRAAFAGFSTPVQDMLNAVQITHMWGLFRHQVAPRWVGGHCAMLGDAAHPTLPFLAQGANLALEDAWVLGAELARCDTLEAGLAAYQDARIGRVRKVIDAATGNAWKYHLKPGPLRVAAHTVLGLGARLAPARMMGQFDWLYGHDVTQTR